MTKKEIFIILVLVAIAGVRYFYFLPKALPYTDAVGQSVLVRGVVSSDVDTRLNNKRLTVTPEGQESNVLAVVSVDEDVAYGDEVEVRGLLTTPENFITQSGKEFNYERYLHNQDIYFVIKNAKVKILSHNNGSYLQAKLFQFKNNFIHRVGEVIQNPESDLADGLLLGSRGGFDSDQRNEFISTGTIHIIALSGYNVTIVAKSVMWFFGFFLPILVSLWAGLVMILLFVLMSGASATAVRAGIMAVIALVAQMTGRTYDAGRALVIAGAGMVAYDPRVLTDMSFQLSFLATFGVLFITPKVVPWLMFLPARFKFRETVATTVAATIAVLPLLLYSTGILSLVSLPANVLILPIIPVTMFFSFLAGIFGFIFHIFALPFGFIAYLLLTYILHIIHFFASLPFASVVIPYFPLVLTFILYALLVYWVFRKNKSIS